MKWLPFELHTHTPHSDGRHTLLEMCRKAKELGLAGIALTDHNTTSGMAEAQAATEETGISVIPGLEWTTFYGHMLTLGVPYSEWRDLGPHDIHKGIQRVHDQGGIVGIAHPYSMGSPICTGCHWEYTIKDWHDIDYMEVWHETIPPMRNHNAPALKRWTELLNEGYRIAATAGRDWHHSSDSDEPPAFTYIALPDNLDEEHLQEAVIEAVRKGRLSLSMGPLLTVQAAVGKALYEIGDCIPYQQSDEVVQLVVRITETEVDVRSAHIERQGMDVVVESNLGELGRAAFRGEECRFTVQRDGLIWLRVHVQGMMKQLKTTIAFANPIYFDAKKNDAGQVRTQIIAHTGCEGTPDNTLQSAMAGYAAGAQVLEVDVRATKDGVCVLYHDDHPAFGELTYEEMMKQNPLELKDDSELERLATVLSHFRGKPVSFNLDVKNDEAAEPVLRLLETMDMREQIYFTGATSVIAETEYRSGIMWNVPKGWHLLNDADYESAVREACDMAKRREFPGLNVDYPSCRESLVRYAHACGLKVWIYTLMDRELAVQYADMGVDAISTYAVSAGVELVEGLKSALRDVERGMP
ncbi:CehA/McbA family metallohydrolase [Paenibacillus sp. J5C_2022]|uniref:CehA/McbA family metallohydrolase n=1 Tax=Paenibacillus sp. J5C2022 TaxID=2977129 RepID=UPI0021D12EC0|nr:CehA/McbA family metallohydrolase [Paenibacillus sp. J5C2022]MCU6710959.1 CehA/McbA family metallohydrolase [Paenibacillus sp. J5C2022]